MSKKHLFEVSYVDRLLRERDAAEAAGYRRGREEMNWQPIETVPQDEYVITTDGKFRRFEKFPREYEEAVLDEWVGDNWKPTHWIQTPPLPGETK